MKITQPNWKLTVAALVMQLLLVSVSLAQKDNATDLNNRTIDNVELQGASLMEVLEPFARKYQIPIGLEIGGNTRCELRKELNLKFESVTVVDAVDSVLELTNNCRVLYKDGVVRISPVAGRSAVLDFELAGLKIRPGASGTEIGELISGNKTLRNRLDLEGLRLVSFGMKDDVKVFSDEFKVESCKSSFETVLNSYIRYSPAHFWVMDFDEEQRKYFVRY